MVYVWVCVFVVYVLCRRFFILACREMRFFTPLLLILLWSSSCRERERVSNISDILYNTRAIVFLRDRKYISTFLFMMGFCVQRQQQQLWELFFGVVRTNERTRPELMLRNIEALVVATGGWKEGSVKGGIGGVGFVFVRFSMCSKF